MEGLEHAITNWEDALSVGIPQLGTGTFALPLIFAFFNCVLYTGNFPFQAVGESEFTHQLERFIEKALELQDECEMMFNDHRTVLPSGDDLGTIHEMSKVMLIGEREVIGESGEETSTSDFEDFVSATEEIANIEELLADLPETWRLYQSGLKQVQYGYVPCRTLRTEMLRCSSDADFLAKLVCVRKAFAYILTDARMRCWFADTGREIITNLLAHGDKVTAHP
ncbi:PREDICTED: protein FAM73B-like [Priapulus caudatus]|uniref:Protein FAM73B-like n=1 Tax=Priapulus caudatus TaxID=37621 RepID=A0ABM1E628_PRICU|nr:PREDICTED: protein FAM73B-like [Priapulus caudatus]